MVTIATQHALDRMMGQKKRICSTPQSELWKQSGALLEIEFGITDARSGVGRKGPPYRIVRVSRRVFRRDQNYIILVLDGIRLRVARPVKGVVIAHPATPFEDSGRATR